MANFFHRWDDIQKLKGGTMVAPHMVDFHHCYTCNQHCVGCAYDGALNHEPQMWMSREDIFNATNQFMDAGVRGFDFAGGGEPTIPPYMPDLIRHIGVRGGTCGLITNGTLLRGDLLEAMLQYGTYARISLEASNPDTYRIYKAVDHNHWNTVLKNVREAIIIRNDRKSKLEISIKFAVGKDTRGTAHYWDGICLGKELGADRITFKALRECPQELSLEEKQVEDRLLRGVLIQTGAANVHHWIVPWALKDIAQCWLSLLHLLCEWDGNCYTCCFHQWRKESHLLGNILKTPFTEFWFSDEHWKKQRAIDRHECARADCKFFRHHKDLAEAERGMVHFL